MMTYIKKKKSLIQSDNEEEYDISRDQIEKGVSGGSPITSGMNSNFNKYNNFKSKIKVLNSPRGSRKLSLNNDTGSLHNVPANSGAKNYGTNNHSSGGNNFVTNSNNNNNLPQNLNLNNNPNILNPLSGNKNYRFSNYTSSHEKNKKTLGDIIIKKSSEIQLLEQIHHRKNGLGLIFKSSYNNKEVSCRVIKFDRLSRYDLEGLSKDMEEIT
jgi:hypothetical protein